jgi:hypothetical protein
LKEPSAIDSVVFVVVRDVVGHKFLFGFWFVGCLYLSLPIRSDFIPRIFRGGAKGAGIVRRFLPDSFLAMFVFAKTPRSGVGSERGVLQGANYSQSPTSRSASSAARARELISCKN